VAKRGFLISFTATPRLPTGVHRILNWAEDLFRVVTRNGWGTVEDLDWSTDEVWVIAASPRVTGSLTAAISRTLKHSNLFDDATVTKLATDEDWRGYETFQSQRAARRLTRR
jgi:hypothetical protein